jgi:hypothetical protein
MGNAEVSMFKQVLRAVATVLQRVNSGSVELLSQAVQRREAVTYLLAVLSALSNNYLVF